LLKTCFNWDKYLPSSIIKLANEALKLINLPNSIKWIFICTDSYICKELCQATYVKIPRKFIFPFKIKRICAGPDMIVTERIEKKMNKKIKFTFS